MKSTLFIFIVLIALSSAFKARRTDQTLYEALGGSTNLTTLKGNLQDLSDFLTAFGDYFYVDLRSCLKCYNDTTAQAFFNLLGVQYLTVEALINGDKIKVALFEKAAIALNATLANATNCMRSTQAYLDLQKAAGFGDNVTQNEIFVQIYAEGQMNNFYNGFTPIYNQLNKGYYKNAGNLMRPLYEKIAKNSTGTMAFQNGVQAFHFGIFYYYNLSAPTQIWSCWNGQTSAAYLQFLSGWVQAVANSSDTTAGEATKEYMENTGEQILDKMAPEVACEDKTQDMTNLNKAVGYDIHSQEFEGFMEKFIEDHESEYFYQFTQMEAAAQSLKPITMGYEYGIFLSQIAQDANDEDLEL